MQATDQQDHDPGPRIELSLLDGFQVRGLAPSLSPGSVWRIAAYLALRGPAQRHRIAGALWPEAPQHSAMARLRSGVWRLQREVPQLLDARRGVLALSPYVSTDAARLVATAQSILLSDSHLPADFSLLLRDNDLTPEWHDDWILVERERLRQLRLEALDALADRLIAAGRPGLAMQAAVAALSTDPMRESSCQRVIQVHLLHGNLVQARHQYDSYAALLRGELGVDPSPLTRRLFSVDERGQGVTRRAG
jgi:DNA-binding SARP family transcriptional activator